MSLSAETTGSVLGETLAEIAGEKAGTLKADVPAIAGPLPPEAAAVVTAKAQMLQAPVTWVKPARETNHQDQTLIYEGIKYPQRLLG